MYTQGELLTFEARQKSEFRLSSKAKGMAIMEVKLDDAWRDLDSDEGVKALKKNLETKAADYIEDLVKRNQFTSQQYKKLLLAAGVQVARDCRRIHQLRLAYFDAAHDEPFKNPGDIDNMALMNVISDCKGTLNEIDGIMVGGIDRKDSLFRKVLNNLQ